MTLFKLNNAAKLVAACLLFSAISACGTTQPPMNPADKAKAMAPAKQLFSSQTNINQYRTAEERKVAQALITFFNGQIKRDIATITPLLHNEFVSTTETGENKVIPVGRKDYIDIRKVWNTTKLNRNLSYNFIELSIDKAAKSANVIALVQEKTKYFEPKMLETFVLVKDSGNWKIRAQNIRPLTPNSPSLLEASIIVGKALEDSKGAQPTGFFARTFNDSIFEKGPIAVIDKLVPLKRDQKSSFFAGGDIKANIVVAFKEPPATGSDITTHITADCGRTMRTFTRVRNVSPFYIQVSDAKLNSCANKLNVKVDVNGYIVADKDFNLE